MAEQAADGLLARIVRESGVPDLVAALAERLSPTDLQSLLLEVYRQRAARQRPAALLDRYARDRFVRPSSTDVHTMAAFDRLALELAAQATPPFEAVELSPLCPLGTNSVVATVSQNVAVTTIRNTEVVSDSTNVLALECALRRRAGRRSPDGGPDRIRLCASHRVVRAQRFDRPEALAHFRLFARCTAGRDEGSRRFELESVAEHLALHLRLLTAWRRQAGATGSFRVAVTPLAQWASPDRVQTALVAPLAAAFPDVSVGLDLDRSSGRGYYEELCFNVYAQDEQGHEVQLVDGGCTNWTQQLLSDGKERLLISGVGSERVCTLFIRPAAP